MRLGTQLLIKMANTSPAPLLSLFWSLGVVIVVSICGAGTAEVCSVNSHLTSFSDGDVRIKRVSGINHPACKIFINALNSYNHANVSC